MSFHLHGAFGLSVDTVMPPPDGGGASARPRLDEALLFRWRDCIDHLSAGHLWPSPHEERALLAFLASVLIHWDGWPRNWGLLLATRRGGRLTNLHASTDIIASRGDDRRQIAIYWGSDAHGRYHSVLLTDHPRYPGGHSGPPARPGAREEAVPMEGARNAPLTQHLRGTMSALNDFFDALACGMQLAARPAARAPVTVDGRRVQGAFTAWLRGLPEEALAALPVPPEVVWRRRGAEGIVARTTGLTPGLSLPVLGVQRLVVRSAEVRAMAAMIRSGGWSERLLEPMLLLVTRLPAAAGLCVRGRALTMVSGDAARRYRCFPFHGTDRAASIFRESAGHPFRPGEGREGYVGPDAFLEVLRQHLQPPASLLSMVALRHRLADILEANALAASVALALGERFPGHQDPDWLYRQCWGRTGLTLQGRQLLDPSPRAFWPFRTGTLISAMQESRRSGLHWRQALFDRRCDLFDVPRVMMNLSRLHRMTLLRDELAWQLHVYGHWRRFGEQLRMQATGRSVVSTGYNQPQLRADIEEQAALHSAGSLLVPSGSPTGLAG